MSDPLERLSAHHGPVVESYRLCAPKRLARSIAPRPTVTIASRHSAAS